MGEVYLAEDTRLNRKVAIKLLTDDFNKNADRLHRFTQEAKAASALNHPNILTVYDIGETESGTHFIATEYIEGETMRHHIKDSRMKTREVLDAIVQVASALSTAHQAGIIHRDIKPENIMLRPDGYAKVLDFGLAKLTEKPTPTTDSDAATISKKETDPGTIMGTVQYMSPEQARGIEVDARTDIFSLGIVLYEMIAGHPPFVGESSTDVLAAILDKEPPPLGRFAPDVPQELQRIVNKCLRKERGERYQTMKDLLLDLKELRDELALEAKLERSVRPETSKATSHATLLAEAEITQEAAAQPTTAATAQTTSSAEYLVSEVGKHKRGVALGSIILLALIGFGYWFFFNRSSGSTDAIDSIAVLPFESKSSDADTEYLSDGLAESLIYRLSQLPNLKVSPTSSVFRYKGKEKDPIKIGSELGVNAVMSGRIVQRGDNLTISVELVDVRNNKTLWGEQYDRRLADLLATQREIATEITQRLQLKLSGTDQKGLNKRDTENNEAYQPYLKGRYHLAKRTKDDMQRGIEYFQQAIKLDPNYALAYVGIAESYNTMPSFSYLSPKEAIPQGKAAATRALEIDPTLAEAHVALAASLAVLDWNWVEAEREFKRALELNPNIAYAHYRYGLNYLIPMGRTDEAITEIKRAVELEPLELLIGANLAAAYLYGRQYDRALEQARKTHDLEPNFVTGRVWLGRVYNANGMYDEAIALSEKSLQSYPTNQSFLQIAGLGYAKAGRRREAEEIIKRFNEIAKTLYVSHYWVAATYAALGERDEAFAELERAFEERDYFLPRLKIDPLMDPLRDDPRFKDLIRRMGLPE